MEIDAITFFEKTVDKAEEMGYTVLEVRNN